MSYVPINGLRMLAVETSILLATTVLAFLFLRFFIVQFSVRAG